MAGIPTGILADSAGDWERIQISGVFLVGVRVGNPDRRHFGGGMSVKSAINIGELRVIIGGLLPEWAIVDHQYDEDCLVVTKEGGSTYFKATLCDDGLLVTAHGWREIGSFKLVVYYSDPEFLGRLEGFLWSNSGFTSGFTS